MHLQALRANEARVCVGQHVTFRSMISQRCICICTVLQPSIKQACLQSETHMMRARKALARLKTKSSVWTVDDVRGAYYSHVVCSMLRDVLLQLG
jgi:hypothetical protein